MIVCSTQLLVLLRQGHKLHTKEAQRRELFLAHLQMELQDCTKITSELSRRKVVSSKVDSNFKKDDGCARYLPSFHVLARLSSHIPLTAH